MVSLLAYCIQILSFLVLLCSVFGYVTLRTPHRRVPFNCEELPGERSRVERPPNGVPLVDLVASSLAEPRLRV